MIHSILFTGDFCPNFNDLDKNSFSDIENIITNNELLVCNLECAAYHNNQKAIIKEGPSLCCQNDQLDYITKYCPTLFTLANNHTLDFGEQGLINILSYCNKKKYNYVGAGINLKEASKPYIYEKESYKIAFINCCEHEFSIAQKDSSGANPMDVIKIYNQIQEVKNISNFIIIVAHGGHEYYQLPSPRLQDTYRFFIDSGANAVIGHHPHCISGMENYKNGIIYYSLGNFYFNNRTSQISKWNEGMLLELKIDSKTNKILSHTPIPFIQCHNNNKIITLRDNEFIEFNKSFYSLSTIIKDRDLLENYYTQYLLSQEKKAISRILPYTNKYLIALYKRGLLPSFMKKNNYATRLNALQCESHRDILQYILHKKINE